MPPDLSEILARKQAERLTRKPQRRTAAEHPRGWEPHVEVSGDRAEAVSQPTTEADPDEQWLIREWGMDPAEWRIEGPVNCRRWQANLGDGQVEWMHYYKANLVRRTDSGLDLETLLGIGKRRPRKRPTLEVPDERTLIAVVADTQLGKGSKGVGPQDFVDGWDDYIGLVEDRWRDLKRLGRPATRLFAVGGGDTTEGCQGNYASQPFTVQLNEAEQVELASWAIDRAIDRWAAMAPEVLSTTPSSNHDAKRQGKDYPTGRSDCRAFTVWRSLARAYSKNDERYGHVHIWLPEDPDVWTVDLHGVGVAGIHGDLATKGANPPAKMWNWLSGQTMGGLPAGDCSVLVTAHYHHFWVLEQNAKTLLGSPALDVVGSKWLTDMAGIWSEPGLLTLVVDESGVSDVHVLRP